MKWLRADYEAMIGLRKEKQTRKKKRKKVRMARRGIPKELLHSIMLAKLLGRDNKNTQQKKAIAATLTKTNMNGMGWL